LSPFFRGSEPCGYSWLFFNCSASKQTGKLGFLQDRFAVEMDELKQLGTNSEPGAWQEEEWLWTNNEL
jgi:hypothetical protein